jgi:hypothetical protein
MSDVYDLPFGQRHGYDTVKPVQVDGMDGRLRNALWNCIHTELKVSSNTLQRYQFSRTSTYGLYKRIFDEVIGVRTDTLPYQQHQMVALLGKWVGDAPWFKVYELVEFIARGQTNDEDFVKCCNRALERESAGYRLLNGRVVPIVSPEELSEVESAIRLSGGPVSTHLNAALSAIADRNNPSPRKVVHESISAVESAVRALLGDSNITLGEGLKKLDLDLHPALSKGLGVIYGWTSDAKSGIRHGLSEKPWEVDAADARYMLIACSAFINYLRAKSGQELP